MRRISIIIISFMCALGLSLGIIKSLALDNGVGAVYKIEEGQTGDIVPGEFIVKYKAGKSPEELQELTALRSERAQSALGKIINQLENIRLQSKGESIPEELLAELEQIEEELEILRHQTLFGRIDLVKTRQNLAPGFFIARYGRLDTVEYIETNRIFKLRDKGKAIYSVKGLALNSAPNDPLYPEMWNLQKDLQGLDMAGAWELAKGSANVTVAVVDSGIDFSHEDFQGRNILPGRDFATCDFAMGEVDGEPLCLIEKNCTKLDQGYCDDDPTDDLGHGTHVSGTIGAVTNNSRGIAGINWDVTLLPVKSANFMGQLLTSWIIQGMTYAVDQGADIINMSFGGEGTCSSSMQEVIDYARSRGVAVVVAAGNSDLDAGGFDPASCNGVIVVGATGPGKGRAGYSNFGAVVDIAAPGGNPSEDRNKDGYLDSLDCIRAECILSTYPPLEKYEILAGTSMAAPHITGVAALLLAASPGLPPDEIEQILKRTADPLTTDKPIGNFVNPQKALGSTRPSPTATLPPSRPTPTLAFEGCPAECPADKPPRSHGNADCDNDIDQADYYSWQEQWELYARGEQLPAEERSADFDCRGGDVTTQYITLSDYEFWRRHVFGGVGGPTVTPTGGVQPTATPTPTGGMTPAPTATGAPTATPTPTSTPTLTPTGTVVPTPTATATPIPTATPTPTSTPTLTPTVVPSPTTAPQVFINTIAAAPPWEHLWDEGARVFYGGDSTSDSPLYTLEIEGSLGYVHSGNLTGPVLFTIDLSANTIHVGSSSSGPVAYTLEYDLSGDEYRASIHEGGLAGPVIYRIIDYIMYQGETGGIVVLWGSDDFRGLVRFILPIFADRR